MKRCLIFSAGTFYGLRERPAAGDFVIAADAGYLTCKKLGIVPDLLLGDFDSMPQPADFRQVVRVPVEKDDTDTMLAAKAGIAHGCERFYLYGATGGRRLDHTLANIQTLLWLRRQGASAFIYDDCFVFTVIENESLTIEKTVDWGLLSVFSIGEKACGISESGVQYPLSGGTLTAELPMGVSNHILEDTAAVRVEEGALLVGWELPPASAIL